MKSCAPSPRENEEQIKAEATLGDHIAGKASPAKTKKVYFLQTGVVHGKAEESAELLL